MSCALLFCLANLYLSAEVQPGQQVEKNLEGPWCENHWCRGPVGDVRIGMRAYLPNGWQMDYGVMHRSYIMEHDRGYEGVFIKIEWRPFQ